MTGLCDWTPRVGRVSHPCEKGTRVGHKKKSNHHGNPEAAHGEKELHAVGTEGLQITICQNYPSLTWSLLGDVVWMYMSVILV